jgi:hypothetical protein
LSGGDFHFSDTPLTAEVCLWGRLPTCPNLALFGILSRVDRPALDTLARTLRQKPAPEFSISATAALNEQELTGVAAGRLGLFGSIAHAAAFHAAIVTELA